MATDRGLVRFGDTATIEYEVRRSERRKKTVQITVDGSGVQVAAPITTPDSEVQAIVRKRAAWILSHVADTAAGAVPKRFVSGETLPYLGRNVRLIVEPADVGAPQVRFDHWRFRVLIPEGLEEEDRYQRIRRAVVDWYRGRAEERLRSGVQGWWPRSGQRRRTENTHTGPAPTLGKLRPGRYAAVQLAGNDAGSVSWSNT